MIKKIKIFIAFVLISCIMLTNFLFSYAESIYFKTFSEFKANIRYDVQYDVIKNEDKTTAYIIYNNDGDLYNEVMTIKSPDELLDIKPATSSIIIENQSLYGISTISETNVIKQSNDINLRSGYSNNIVYDNLTNKEDQRALKIISVGELENEKYYPVVFRKKTMVKIPKEIVKKMQHLDFLVIFNVSRFDMKPEDGWKFRYVDDIIVNRFGNHKIDSDIKKDISCIEHEYLYKHENVSLMRFEYTKANGKSSYAYIDKDNILNKEIDEGDLIDNCYFMSDEWQVNYDDGDVDYFLRKWVTYKVNIYKEVFDKAMVQVGNMLDDLAFDDLGYVKNIKLHRKLQDK